MNIVSTTLVLFSILFPSKTWYAPTQPIEITIRDANVPVALALLDFTGKPIDPQGGSGDVEPQKPIDLRPLWPQLNTPGTYVLLATPRGRTVDDFVGTPLVIEVRPDTRRDAPGGAMAVKIEPLCYATLATEQGEMTIVFFYDAAPHTVGNFISLSRGGFYDGLTFHRLIPNFILQGGDPRGDGTGGPGYHIEAEFNDHQHLRGVLSMARQGDPLEAQGVLPRPVAANSGGSQFFICLDYERTKQLDGRYTAFGQVVKGMETVKTLAATPTDPQTDRPTQPLVIQSVKVEPVTPDYNPYGEILHFRSTGAATQPAAR